MDHGIVTFLTDYGIDPVQLGRAVEERGFGSLFLTEHTHIPTSRLTPWPVGAPEAQPLPRHYAHTFDPLAALAAIAATTQRIRLGTGVTLVNQHHPITLAKQVASVDRISGGRFELGVGPGWNAEEMANHGVDPARPLARMLEHVAAMRKIWTEEEPEFHGEFVDFDPIWSWPKPARRLPVLIGGVGPTVLDRVLSHGDGWLPLPLFTAEQLGARITTLRRRAADAGRTVNVTLYGGSPDALGPYQEAGVDRVLFELPDHENPDDILRELDRLAGFRPATGPAKPSGDRVGAD
ncbi:LLM class F420-dependent oxidoreductase [Streptomyces johnsoniae]|uniref:LLM class F420-dependent oxidoreductase n=1 Tax=Streptomyces johnsoniae TaxID=3075532 RepID=A0ABU2SD21_9ACTN|nr:LLM class F420-dependent oxidoreductase [Streptomyces sp. DSM 41886]MDT0446703.1 LLM class F420-dependent oxidoreductase [Streptomyces sp. DSM 41886]